MAGIMLCAGSGAWGATAPIEIVGVKASSTQTASRLEKNLINGSGLSETSPGSGVWVHGSDAYRDKGVEVGTMWASGLSDGKTERMPTLTFDLGKQCAVGSFRVWNYNEAGWTTLGFKEVEVSASADGEKFTPVGTAIFDLAPGENDYEGQLISFKQAVQARYIRLHCLSNWQGERSALSEIRFFAEGAGAADAIAPGVKPVAKSTEVAPNHPNPPRPAIPGSENIIFPANSGVIDVTAAPYLAKGDGVADDTKAIQRALSDYPAKGAIIYLPNGTYLISNTLKWGAGQHDHEKQKLTVLQGQSCVGTIIRLKDACPGFTDPAKPKEMVWTGGAPAQRFRNQIRNCTWHTGKGNPGAIGVRFFASNVGCLRDVDIRSGDGSGVIGLDQSYADDFGPCFVKNISVTGFDVGIANKYGVAGVVFENVRLRGQRKVGWLNNGQAITVRHLISESSVPAIQQEKWGGLFTIIDASLDASFGPPWTSAPAILLQSGGMFARNVRTYGYVNAIQHGNNLIPNPLPREWASAKLPGSGATTLNLPVKETPDVPWDELKDWAVITDFGAKMDGKTDDSDALQRAIDSGKKTVCLPRGAVALKKPIIIRGAVRRLLGCETFLKFPSPMTGVSSIFTVGESPEPTLVVERFACWFWDNKAGLNFINNPTQRTLVLREISDVDDTSDQHPNGKGTIISGPGELFVEDVTGRFHLQPGARAWMRYINPETNQDHRNTQIEAQWHLRNDGGHLWILGLKTEGPGPVVITRNGGRTELLGGLMYSSGGARTQDQPAFIFEDSQGSVSITEANFSNNAYKSLVVVTKKGETAIELKPGQALGIPRGMIPFWATP
ncbi:MAG: glycosyl hydrolase family 28-related protein [Candidatus Sumerlaeota bacterium]|nr:glycosyl hydrolase family 28-related protein [Candidatus Sumerlaeota bacterium]